MLGTEYKWLLAPVRSAAEFRAQLAGRSLMTLAVATFCLVCTFLPAPRTPAPAVTIPTPIVASLDESAVEWPRTLVHLWFLLPQLLPARN